jgi:hypothetical protein
VRNVAHREHSLTILHPIASNTLTVPKLKELLTAKSLPTTGKKADLIQRLEENGVAAETTETADQPHADTTVRSRFWRNVARQISPTQS